MNYREFIALVRRLWEEIYPDIPILPVQGDTYARYPLIVYSLENRKTHTTEPKQRYREEVVTDSDENVIISGQRFQNYIAFSVVTENEPDLCETIIETFEDFMLEHTPVFKRLGLSDIFYSRRLSDREETRTAEDACIRTVVYMCIIERTTRVKVSKLEEVLTNIALKGIDVKPLGENTGWVPTTGSVEYGPTGYDSSTDFVGNNQIVYLGKEKLSVGNEVTIHRPHTESLKLRFVSNEWQPAETEFEDSKAVLPKGLISGNIYTVESIDNNVLTLSRDGTIVDIASPGWAKITLHHKLEIDLDDSAT